MGSSMYDSFSFLVFCSSFFFSIFAFYINDAFFWSLLFWNGFVQMMSYLDSCQGTIETWSSLRSLPVHTVVGISDISPLQVGSSISSPISSSSSPSSRPVFGGNSTVDTPSLSTPVPMNDGWDDFDLGISQPVAVDSVKQAMPSSQLDGRDTRPSVVAPSTRESKRVSSLSSSQPLSTIAPQANRSQLSTPKSNIQSSSTAMEKKDASLFNDLDSFMNSTISKSSSQPTASNAMTSGTKPSNSDLFKSMISPSALSASSGSSTSGSRQGKSRRGGLLGASRMPT